MVAALTGAILVRLPHPVPPEAMRELGDRYNRALKGRPAGAALREVLRRASLWPMLGPQGGAVTMQLSF